MTLYPKAKPWGGLTEVAELNIGTSLGKCTVSNKPRRVKRKSNDHMTGYIKMYNLERRFGFIQSGKEDFFFHSSAFSPELDYVMPGEAVHFTVEIDKSGRTIAKNLTLVG